MLSKKYIPHGLGELSFNQNLTNILYKIADTNEIVNNILIHGTAGSGKKTRMLSLLSEIYGNNIYCPSVVNGNLKNHGSDKSYEFNYKSTDYYIDITPSNYGIHDKNIISHFIKNIIGNYNPITQSYKIFIINHVDKLTMGAQQMLRRIIGQNTNTTRFIFIATSLSKIIDPLLSRFMTLRHSSPSNEEALEIIRNISEKEEIKASTRAINIIINNCLKNCGILNLTYLINMFQMSYISGKYSTYKIRHIVKIDKIIELIDKKYSKDTINKIRTLIYDLYVNNIDLIEIMKYILRHYCEKLENPSKIIKSCAQNNVQMAKGNKEPLYLEAFILDIIKSIHFEEEPVFLPKKDPISSPTEVKKKQPKTIKPKISTKTSIKIPIKSSDLSIRGSETSSQKQSIKIDLDCISPSKPLRPVKSSDLSINDITKKTKRLKIV